MRGVITRFCRARTSATLPRLSHYIVQEAIRMNSATRMSLPLSAIALMTLTLLATGSMLGHGWAEAQSPDPIRTRCDVVSIKPSRSGSTSRSIENQGWRYVARNIPVTSLIISAYRVPVESMLNDLTTFSRPIVWCQQRRRGFPTRKGSVAAATRQLSGSTRAPRGGR